MARLVRKQAEKTQAESDFLADTRRVAALAADRKAIGIKAYDVRGLTLIADSFVICGAASEPQMKAIANAVRDGMKEVGVKTYHVEGETGSVWLVMDFGHILFHLFRVEARAFYDLDGLWADAPDIPLDLD